MTLDFYNGSLITVCLALIGCIVTVIRLWAKDIKSVRQLDEKKLKFEAEDRKRTEKIIQNNTAAMTKLEAIVNTVLIKMDERR